MAVHGTYSFVARCYDRSLGMSRIESRMHVYVVFSFHGTLLAWHRTVFLVSAMDFMMIILRRLQQPDSGTVVSLSSFSSCILRQCGHLQDRQVAQVRKCCDLCYNCLIGVIDQACLNKQMSMNLLGRSFLME